ncbi:MAG: DUF418 domain-containing protein [Muribaculaceae bacterium]|nr:DUF418 domain-containing protein [Muribaculaceae bacterium]
MNFLWSRIRIRSLTGLIYGEIIALTVFVFEIAFSSAWLEYFRFGPLEWIWRCLTYLRIFPIRKQRNSDHSISEMIGTLYLRNIPVCENREFQYQ